MNYTLLDDVDIGRLRAGIAPAKTPLGYYEAHAAAQQMAAHGGGFAGAIADAYFRADGDNAARLRAAFDALFRAYIPGG